MDTIIDARAAIELVKVLLCSCQLVLPRCKALAIHTAQHIELKASEKSSINYIVDVNSLNKEEKLGDFGTWRDHNDSNHNLQVEASFHLSQEGAIHHTQANFLLYTWLLYNYYYLI